MLEFDLIARIRQRAGLREDVVLGIGDDCALLSPPAGMQLAVTTDTLNCGVHFPEETAPFDIGWKALAVNLSDLAAMGARPAWCTLSLSLPEAEAGFVDGFLDGFLTMAQRHDVAIVGGDTTRGPLSISVAALGFIGPGQALRRDGARAGDDIWVSGTLGDAAAALAQWQANAPIDLALRARLDRPTPRLELGRALCGIASACIDVSDGLLADLAHVCDASGVGAELQLEALPASAALDAAFDLGTRRQLQATGGDDYELCFCAQAVHRAQVEAIARDIGTPVKRIGQVTEGCRVIVRSSQGETWLPPSAGYVHFGETAAKPSERRQ
ncbi:MAG: thiamine-phosphate kinase [Thermomonas sp.]|uniref:thiamine-phosphate kinase n=1 Tax=Thermomonas sp. TaxID=1971895 RepID=UPI00262EE6C3|nr:thiamine-phosphate kinase [Thermomonas sp.]MCC7096404.1 thiamine-phosphate kinase [Thermomonas sp.]